MKKTKETAIIASILIYVILVIVFSKEMAISVLNSIEKCIKVIIPSLYIFMIISDFIISSNIYFVWAKPFSIVSRYFFRIPEQFFPLYIISNIGGYPVGAKLISDMVKENKMDNKTAESMMNYCYFSGPAFIIGIVGANIFSDIKIGIIIFISLFITNFIIAVITGLGRTIPSSNKYTPELDISISNFIKSIYNGGKSLFYICAIIIFFSSILCIVENSGIISAISRLIDRYTYFGYSDGIAMINSFIEISNISLFESDIKNIPLITSLLSFGGLCILLQVKSIIPNLSLKNFLFFRIVAIFLSYFISKLICLITYDFIYPVYSPARLSHGQNSPIITLFLLIMTILFLLKFSIEKSRKI